MMRGHSFPPREHGADGLNGYMAPYHHNGHVPIDPILAQPAVDHHMLPDQSWAMHPTPQMADERSLTPSGPPMKLARYSQGPQGDPFAPQAMLPVYYPPEEPMQLQPSKPKKKRKVHIEEECGHCQQGSSSNKAGVPELLVSCCDCGRSAHPTCLNLERMAATLRSYDWQCQVCKSCVVCRRKSDAPHLLLCDVCDRGWHMGCCDPPVEEAPPGEWHCPLCSPSSRHYRPPPSNLDPQLQFYGEMSATPTMEIDPSMDGAIDPALRAMSTPAPQVTYASSKRANARKGKGKAVEQSQEVEEDFAETVDEDDSTAPASSPSKDRKNAIGRKKTKARNGLSQLIMPDDQTSPSRPLKRPRNKGPSPPPTPSEPNTRRTVVLKLPTKGKGKGKEADEEEEAPKGMFDDVLTADDRDTSKTVVLTTDKDRFEKSKAVAEVKLAPPAPSVDIEDLPFDAAGPSSRPLRSTLHQLQAQVIAARQVSPSPTTPATPFAVHKDTNTLRIRTIRFGPYDIDTWYDAPFPEEFSNCPDGRLWICEFCLKYMKSKFGAQRHRMKCKTRHPPGDEIYRDGVISIFEVDGRKNKIYCQNLCLLSKMFLDHKSLFYDVEPFLFYVITEVDDIGARFVGYFSKEKSNPKDLNLSCIMTLPIRQRRGWGNFLIDFSYLLTKKERKTGTPERPLSALGALGYKAYWTLAVMRYLASAPDNPRLEDISAVTAMTQEDIYVTLVQQDMILVQDAETLSHRPSPGYSVKFNPRRKNGLSRRQSQRSPPLESDKSKKIQIPTVYEIHWDPNRVAEYLRGWDQKGYFTLKPERLKWLPFVVSRIQVSKDLSTLASGSSAGAPGQATLVQNVEIDPATADNDGDKDSEKDLEKAAEPGQNAVENGDKDDDKDGDGITVSKSPILGPPAAVPTSAPATREINGLDRLADAALLFAARAVVPETPKKPESLDVETEMQEVKDGESDGSDAKAIQLAEDEALALQLANSTPEVTRRLRKHSRHTSLQQTPPVASTSTLAEVNVPKIEEPPMRTRLSRITKAASSISAAAKPTEDHVDTDAALAEQLAREDERSRRQLRSASNTTYASTTDLNVPVTPVKKVSSRKRLRVIESPVEEDSSSSAVVSSPVVEVRPITRRSSGKLSVVTNADAPPPPTPPQPVRATRSRNANPPANGVVTRSKRGPEVGLGLRSGRKTAPPPQPRKSLPKARTTPRKRQVAPPPEDSEVEEVVLETPDVGREKSEAELNALPDADEDEDGEAEAEGVDEEEEEAEVLKAVEAIPHNQDTGSEDRYTSRESNGEVVPETPLEASGFVTPNQPQSMYDIPAKNNQRHSVVPSDMTMCATPDANVGQNAKMIEHHAYQAPQQAQANYLQQQYHSQPIEHQPAQYLHSYPSHYVQQDQIFHFVDQQQHPPPTYALPPPSNYLHPQNFTYPDQFQPQYPHYPQQAMMMDHNIPMAPVVQMPVYNPYTLHDHTIYNGHHTMEHSVNGYQYPQPIGNPVNVNGHYLPPPPVAVPVVPPAVPEEDPDLDADGEYDDEDAEGEPDLDYQQYQV